MIRYRYYLASMPGSYHIENGIPCQDSCCIAQNESGVAFAAVADGLGSEKYSDEASQIAARYAVEYCRQRYVTGGKAEEVKDLLKTAFAEAYRAILKQAQAKNRPDDEYDTTLCMAIWDGDRVFYGQAGDSGLIALQRDGHYVRLTRQQRNKDGCVYPLCFGPQMWEFGEVAAPVSALMLMTDGVWEQLCPPLMKNEAVNIHVSLAKMFMDRSETQPEEIDALQQAAFDYLKNYPARLLDDDKTVVVLYDPQQPAERLPPEYYAAPDWEKLYKKATQALYKSEPTEKDGSKAERPETDADTAKQAPQAKPDAPNAPDAPDASDALPDNADGKGEAADPAQPLPRCQSPPGGGGRRFKRSRRSKHKKPRRLFTRHAAVTGRAREWLAVGLLLTVSMAAFAISGFVKDHAPESCFGIFCVCLIANSTILLPAPSLLVVLQYSMLIDPAAVALCAALGASLGEMVGFYAGAHGGRLLDSALTRRLRAAFPAYPYLFVFIFSALPLPFFDVIGMLAGAARLKPWRFYVTCLCGKALKMAAFAVLGRGLSKIIF